MTDKSAIIFGATGAVGKPVVAELVSSPYYTSVHAFVRRPFKAQSAYKDEAKLVEHIVDFDKLTEGSAGAQEIKALGAEAVYITLGTTRALAGSASEFVKIDRDYVLAAAKAAVSGSGDNSQRVIYCSSGMANSQSRFLYTQSKGLTEEGLASLGYSDCLLFRPGFLAGAQREKTRIMESVAGVLTSKLASHFSDSVDIQVTDLAKAMVLAGVKGAAGITSLGAGSPPSDTFKRSKDSKVTIVGNAEAKRMAKAA